MIEIEFEPDLSHCIQTLTKAEYDRLKKLLLQSGTQDSEIADRVEMLRAFLESTDFRKLRSEYEPYLVEGKHVKFILSAEGHEVLREDR